MKFFNTLLTAAVVLLSFNTFAYNRGSYGVDNDYLLACFGTMELRQNVGDKLAIKFGPTISRSCDQVQIRDASSGRIIKTYNPIDLAGQTYTLSDDQVESLSNDCALSVQVLNSTTGLVFANRFIVLNNCRSKNYNNHHQRNNDHLKHSNAYHYEWSNKHHCKLMKDNDFIKLVDDSYCH